MWDSLYLPMGKLKVKHPVYLWQVNFVFISVLLNVSNYCETILSESSFTKKTVIFVPAEPDLFCFRRFLFCLEMEISSFELQYLLLLYLTFVSQSLSNVTTVTTMICNSGCGNLQLRRFPFLEKQSFFQSLYYRIIWSDITSFQFPSIQVPCSCNSLYATKCWGYFFIPIFCKLYKAKPMSYDV